MVLSERPDRKRRSFAPYDIIIYHIISYAPKKLIPSKVLQRFFVPDPRLIVPDPHMNVPDPRMIVPDPRMFLTSSIIPSITVLLAKISIYDEFGSG